MPATAQGIERAQVAGHALTLMRRPASWQCVGGKFEAYRQGRLGTEATIGQAKPVPVFRHSPMSAFG